MYNQEIVRNRGSFRLKQGKMLFIRFGSANAQRQLHARRPIDMATLESREWDVEEKGAYEDYHHRPPCNRGIWAFPYPLHDAFFYYHVFRRDLPKKFKDGFRPDLKEMEDEEREAYFAEETKLIERERRAKRARMIWWEGPIFSRIQPHPAMPEQPWYLYDSPTEWFEVARKHVVGFSNFDEGKLYYGSQVFRRYSCDHFEVFLPMHGEISRKVRGKGR